jgi:hypothetical protein
VEAISHCSKWFSFLSCRNRIVGRERIEVANTTNRLLLQRRLAHPLLSQLLAERRIHVGLGVLAAEKASGAEDLALCESFRRELL